ncbi:sodium:solute symporter family protein [Arthrobacter rhombi]|uniref:sodium:solute symporter family protein n=1 Tax=Arthrobacter rhombi TaxID=71253 RepID=UPI003FCF4EBE
MTSAGAWTIGLAVGYTALLLFGGRWSRIRAGRTGGQGFFDGGRSFSPWTVAFCITGLFSGSSYISIMELSYRTGISAAWYGVAETVQILLIALLLVKPLREKLVVTVTGIIGDRFGRAAKAIAGVITAVTFPMWSVATTIAFASALTAFTDLPLQWTVTATALLLLVFLWSGGMRSVAFNQTLNCLVFVVMLVIAGFVVLSNPGPGGWQELAASRPAMVDPGNAGLSLIIAWFGTFIVNVPLAQAAFQMTMSCRSPRDGQKGLYAAALFGIPFIVLGALVGTSAAIAVPDEKLGLVAIPYYISETLPAPLVGLFFLGVWACAMGWAGPCQFSGATSLGRDVGSALRPKATEQDLVRYTRYSLVALTALMILYGILRTEQAAWWNVLAWTLRNGATLAPVLAVFLWPLASRRAVHAAMLCGFIAGIAWNQLSGWSATTFFAGIHPVWVGMGINLAVMVVVTLVTVPWESTRDRKRRAASLRYAAGGTLVAAALLAFGEWLGNFGLVGLGLFATVALYSLAIFNLTVASTRRLQLTTPRKTVSVSG